MDLFVVKTIVFLFAITTNYSIEKEIEIVYELAQRVLQHEQMLLEASDICGQIDR